MRSSSSTTVYRACNGSICQTVCLPIRISEGVECREEGGLPDKGAGEEEGW